MSTNETEWESITKENVEAEIEKHKLIEGFLKLKISNLKIYFLLF